MLQYEIRYEKLVFSVVYTHIIKFSFQSNLKSHFDLFFVRSPYHSPSFSVHPSSNYLGPVGQYDFLLLSGAPPKTKDYLTFIWVFDGYTWACLLITLVAVSIVLVLINKISEFLLNITTREPTYKGNNKKYNEYN